MDGDIDNERVTSQIVMEEANRWKTREGIQLDCNGAS